MDRATRSPCPSGDSFAGSAQPNGGGRASRRSVRGGGSVEGGCEGPENDPVDHFHRTAGRQAPARSDPLLIIRSSGMRAAGLFAPGNGAGGSISANNGPAGPGVSLRICRLGLRGPEEQAGGLFLPSNGPAGPGSNSSVGLFKGISHARQANPLGGFRRGVRRARKSCRWVLRARKTVRWTVFTEERAGKPRNIFTDERAGRPRTARPPERAGKPRNIFTDERAGRPRTARPPCGICSVFD